MLARELISDVVTALKTSDTGTMALSWMEVFRIKHLPIVNHREFLGLISDADIYDLFIRENLYPKYAKQELLPNKTICKRAEFYGLSRCDKSMNEEIE